ncbi:MAG: helix-turn-helix domain-containing protein [Candidatus Ornithomonoglobus sp.]
MDYHIIGKNIKTERKKQKLTQERLAETAGISTNFLACIETGVKKGSFDTYVNIANALHTTLDTLTSEVVNACSENPLRNELNYYFDNSDLTVQKMLVDVAKVICSNCYG